MKKMTFLIFLFFLLERLDAQTGICLEYDAAGNRISRNDCMSAFAPTGEESNSLLKSSENAALTQEEIRLFPNPTDGHFQIQTKGLPEETEVAVLDALGRLLYKRPLADGQIDLSGKASGTYYIRIRHGDFDKTVIVIKSDR